jgi:hypothetical protein
MVAFIFEASKSFYSSDQLRGATQQHQHTNWDAAEEGRGRQCKEEGMVIKRGGTVAEKEEDGMMKLISIDCHDCGDCLCQLCVGRGRPGSHLETGQHQHHVSCQRLPFLLT